MSTEWTEESLLGLVGQEENQLLECKSGRLLDENSEKVGEDLSKAVSGFANAQGGTILIGINEDRRGKVRLIGRPDGVDGSWPTDRLQRLVESNVEPRVRVRFSRVPVPSAGAGRVVFVLEVPEGRTAHQAKDRCYYSRSELEFRKLRDYEIRLLLHRASALSGDMHIRCALRRSSLEVLKEQYDDFREITKDLREIMKLGPQRDGEPALADIPALVRQARLSHRWRFDELQIFVGLRNIGERTIRDYDVHIEFELPDAWLLPGGNGAQPRSGFGTEDDIHKLTRLREDRLHAATLSPVLGGRLMPGMSADIARYLLLVPEGFTPGEERASLRWTVFLDDSPASRGEIDLLESVKPHILRRS